MLLGEKLKVVRNKIGMSQNEVAENLRISRQTVSKWENDVYRNIILLELLL